MQTNEESQTMHVQLRVLLAQRALLRLRQLSSEARELPGCFFRRPPNAPTTALLTHFARLVAGGKLSAADGFCRLRADLTAAVLATTITWKRSSRRQSGFMEATMEKHAPKAASGGGSSRHAAASTAHLPLLRPVESQVREQGKIARGLGISEAAARRTGTRRAGRLRLPHQGQLPSALFGRANRRGVPRRGLVWPMRSARSRTDHPGASYRRTRWSTTI